MGTATRHYMGMLAAVLTGCLSGCATINNVAFYPYSTWACNACGAANKAGNIGESRCGKSALRTVADVCLFPIGLVEIIPAAIFIGAKGDWSCNGIYSLDEETRWEAAGVSLEQVVAFKKKGFTPEQAKLELTKQEELAKAKVFKEQEEAKAIENEKKNEKDLKYEMDQKEMDAENRINAKLYAKNKEWQKSIDAVQQIRHFESEPDLLAIQGEAYFHLGKYDQSLNTFDSARNLEPNNKEFRKWSEKIKGTQKEEAKVQAKREKEVRVQGERESKLAYEQAMALTGTSPSTSKAELVRVFVRVARQMAKHTAEQNFTDAERDNKKMSAFDVIWDERFSGGSAELKGIFTQAMDTIDGGDIYYDKN